MSYKAMSTMEKYRVEEGELRMEVGQSLASGQSLALLKTPGFKSWYREAASGARKY